MTFPIVLGSKSVSSRPMVSAASYETHTDEHDYSFLAEDGMTPLDPIGVPGAPLAATAVCPLQEWLATLTIRYYDMIMAVDDDDDDDDDSDDEEDDESDEQDSSQEDLKSPLISGRRRKLARHSTVAEVRIQVSPLSLPFSSAYHEVCHRLTLPNLPTIMMTATSNTPKATEAAFHTDSGYMREDHLEHFAEQMPVKPCLVFSSDRQRLACLIPYPRGPHSVLVSFTLSKPTQQFAPPLRPKLPSYIPTGATSTKAASKQGLIPQALHDPEWLQFPTNASLDIRDSASYWLHNITSICLCNITPGSTSTAALYGASKGRNHQGSSVLLAGCRDGSILGVSFHPLLLAGRLYHPHATNNFSKDGKGKTDHITFLSHITTSFGASPNEEDAKKADNNGPPLPPPLERDVLGKLVVIRESGRALIFQTRMILSSLTHHENDDSGYEYYDPDDSTSAFLYQHDNNMDATDYSDTETDYDYAVQTESSGVMMIHAESFHVVKTGRRNSLPANTRFSEEQDPLLHHHNNISNGAAHQNKHSYGNAMGDTGLLMFVEPLCEYVAGNVCRARWMTGSLVAVLERPKRTRVEMNETTSSNTAPRNRVAQVLAIVPGRPPEPLAALTLTSEDLIESPHTTFSAVEQEDDTNDRYGGGTSTPITPPDSLLLSRDVSASLLEASLGLDYDSSTGCIAINSVRVVSEPPTPRGDIDGNTKLTNSMRNLRVLVFANLWCWKTNTLGFTAVAKFSCHSNLHRPISRLLFTKERLTNARQLVHLHSVGRAWAGNRVRKDLYQLGLMSPPQNVYIRCGLDVTEAAPIMLSPSSVAYASVSHPSGQTSEVEWKESNVPVSYRLAYGAPLVAAMSPGGRSIAVASARGLCVLECSPRAKKFSVARERCYIQKSSNSHPEGRTQRTHVGYRLPPKWHLFGNESEEKAFRVLAMTWWQGNQLAARNHLSGDLLVAVIQLQKQNESSTDPKGTCYLACWSERRLDTAHQRLRPLDETLQASQCEWGVRLPRAFRVKSLHLLAQPASLSHSEPPTSNSKQMERKAVVLLSSITEQSGVTDFLVYQFQVIPSVGRSQSSDSYVEHSPFSVLSKQCSSGVVRAKGVGDSTISVFLASASFQFDLRQRKSRISRDDMSPLSDPEVGEVNAIVGTIGLITSPGGLDAVVITSKGPSLVLAIFSTNKTEQGQGKPIKSSQISSFCLSDVLLAQRSISTSYGENALLDFYVWTFQLADGRIHSWFVPCLEFPFESTPGRRLLNVFSGRVMLGMVCPAGNASTWLQPTPAKTARSFMIGCVPHSPHGCFLGTGQASRKFHRTIAGDFDNSLFAGDFMEHEYLYPKDVEIYPPAFMSSIAALLQSSSSLLLAGASKFSAVHNSTLNAGGDDVKTALLAMNTSDHMRIRSKQYQDATFLGFRLLLLRSVEQYTDDLRKGRGELSASVLAELLHVVRSCTSGHLQFASLILEVGRQLEPSCFAQLFPLPVTQKRVEGKQRETTTTMAPSIIRTRCKSAVSLVTVDDFFMACSSDGSLLIALSSLPILAQGELSRQKSVLLLDHCLRVFEENGKSEKHLFYDFSLDERLALGDIFRFAVKLEDSASQDVVDFHPDEILHLDEASINSSSSSSSRSAQSEDRHDNRRKGYSLACGMFSISWFSRRKATETLPQQQCKTSASKKTSVPLEEVGAIEREQKAKRVSKVHNGDHDGKPTTSCIDKVAQSVATLLLQLTISNKDGQLARAYGWKRAAALAFLLLGQGEPMMSKLSAKECTSLAKSAGEFRVEDVPNSHSSALEDDLSDMLTRCIVACSTEIGVRSAGRIFDLVLILLSRCKHSADCDAIVPGLLLIGITVGHMSGRMEEILDVHEKSITFARCYLKAKVKAGSLFTS